MEPWCQVSIGFPDWDSAEHSAFRYVAPLFADAEADGTSSAWFFIRKNPHWRVRYRPAHPARHARTRIGSQLRDLHRSGVITEAVEAVYEPETYAFGGTEAMTLAHQLWHQDTKHLMTYLTATDRQPDHRRELSILLNTAMLRAAHLDWYEQGDVWARVADHRDPPGEFNALTPAVRRLMSVEPTSLTRPGASLEFAADWATAFTTAGNGLVELTSIGRLHRGLRDVLTHHIIFAWNRLGLPTSTQAALATAAKTVVFGHDPAELHPGQPNTPPIRTEH